MKNDDVLAVKSIIEENALFSEALLTIIGGYTVPLPHRGIYTSNTPQIDYTYFGGYYVSLDMTFDLIAISVTTAGGAGKRARLGIYSSLNKTPDSLILDCGLVAVDAIAVVTSVISQRLKKGLYFI